MWWCGVVVGFYLIRLFCNAAVLQLMSALCSAMCKLWTLKFSRFCYFSLKTNYDIATEKRNHNNKIQWTTWSGMREAILRAQVHLTTDRNALFYKHKHIVHSAHSSVVPWWIRLTVIFRFKKKKFLKGIKLCDCVSQSFFQHINLYIHINISNSMISTDHRILFFGRRRRRRSHHRLATLCQAYQFYFCSFCILSTIRINVLVFSIHNFQFYNQPANGWNTCVCVMIMLWNLNYC